MFDTHVNLHGDAFAEDLDDVLQRAREAGISRFLAICDRFDNFETVHAIASIFITATARKMTNSTAYANISLRRASRACH